MCVCERERERVTERERESQRERERRSVVCVRVADIVTQPQLVCKHIQASSVT